MKILSSTLLAALCITGPAVAAPLDEIAGTWECRLPGVEYNRKPPILFVGAAETKDPDQPVVADVDGFAREVYGRSNITPDQDGWWKVTPAQGQAFLIRPGGTGKSKTAAMDLRRTGGKEGTYRCLRLPPQPAP
ncbi:MAG: hypothetical protein WA373_11780 [Burkholderiales bacterium]